ncbi:MAG: hypothetical protein IPK16_32105 [Anaerolineales bacterium]|nr:hypothetical protein [Anaerolineales bacterium]
MTASIYSLADNRTELASADGAFAKTLGDVQNVAIAIGLIEQPVDLAQLIDAAYLGQ